MEERFLFFMGSERSGGNLLTQMLNAHSLISAPTPSHLVRTLYNNYEKYGNLADDGNWSSLIEDVSGLCNTQLGVWTNTFAADNLTEAIVERTPNAIIRHIYHIEAGGLFIHFIKENKTYEYFERLENDFSESKFIYLARDPRDVVLSHLKSPNHGGDLEKAAVLWNDEQLKFEKIRERLSGRVIYVKYESLISSTKNELERICGFIEVDFEQSMLEYHNDSVVQKNAKRVADWSNLGVGIIENNSGKYRAELGSEQIQQIEDVCAEGMKLAGYTALREYPASANKVIKKREFTSNENTLREHRLAAVKRFVERGQAV